MKKLFLILAAFALTLPALAETDYPSKSAILDLQRGTGRDRIQALPDSVVDADAIAAGAVGASEIADDAVGSAEIGTIVQVYTGTAAIVTTQYTPEFRGQHLIGTVSNTVHLSEDLTTNGWIQLRP